MKEFLITITKHVSAENVEAEELAQYLNDELQDTKKERYNDVLIYLEDFNIEVIDKQKKIQELMGESNNKPVEFPEPTMVMVKKRELDEFISDIDGELLRLFNVTTGNYSEFGEKGAVKLILRHLRVGVPIHFTIEIPFTRVLAWEKLESKIRETPELNVEQRP